TKGMGFEGRRVTVSGSGNVAIYAMEKAIQSGAKVVACSDSSGYIHDEDGIDLDLVKQLKEVRRQRISEYVRVKNKGTHFIPSGKGSIWDVPCDVALPCATQNELSAKDAGKLIKNGTIAVAEGANMPSTPEAVRAFIDAGVL